MLVMRPTEPRRAPQNCVSAEAFATKCFRLTVCYCNAIDSVFVCLFARVVVVVQSDTCA